MRYRLRSKMQIHLINQVLLTNLAIYIVNRFSRENRSQSLCSLRSRRYSRARENGKLEIPPAQKRHILSSAHRMVPPILMYFIYFNYLSNSRIYTSANIRLTFHIFGSFNAMKTKIPRSIQCNNMSSFIAIVLVDVNIIAIYEL